MPNVEIVATTTSKWSTNYNGIETTFSTSSTASGTGDINDADKVIQDTVRRSQVENFKVGHTILAKSDVNQKLQWVYNTENISSISETTHTQRIL